MFTINFPTQYWEDAHFEDDFEESRYDDLCLFVSKWCQGQQEINDNIRKRSMKNYNTWNNEKNHEFVPDTLDQIITTDTGYYVVLRNTSVFLSCARLKQFLKLPSDLKELVCDISKLNADIEFIEHTIDVLYQEIIHKMSVF